MSDWLTMTTEERAASWAAWFRDEVADTDPDAKIGLDCNEALSVANALDGLLCLLTQKRETKRLAMRRYRAKLKERG